MENPLADDLNHILTHTEGLWEELRGQRIFITGGTGFFGCWLLESFVWANNKLGLNATAVVLTRNPDAFRQKAPHLGSQQSVELHAGDVQSFEFPTGRFSHFIHVAGEPWVRFNRSDSLVMFDTIVQGTRHTLDFARDCGAKRFLLTSSGAVYGRQSPGITHISEEYAGGMVTTDPSSVYGEGKRVAELLCTLYAGQYGLETKIARCFAFVGPYLPLDASFAIGNFIHDGLRRGPIQVKGDGAPYRSYLYAADLTIWLWTILFKGKSCFPYNVGSDEAVTIVDLANLVAEQFEPRPRIEIERGNVTGLAGGRYVPSIERVHQDLGLVLTIGLAEAVKRTVDWFRDVANWQGED